MFTARTARFRSGGVRSIRPAIRLIVETAVSGVTGRPEAAWSARLCAVRCRITGIAVTYLRVAGLRRSRRPSADVPRISAGALRARTPAARGMSLDAIGTSAPRNASASASLEVCAAFVERCAISSASG